MKKLIYLLIWICSGTANATLISYTNVAQWEDNAINITRIDFSDHDRLEYAGTIVEEDGVTFSGDRAQFYYQGYNTFGTPQWLDMKWFSLEQAVNGTYLMEFSAPISALSFDFADYYHAAMTLSLNLNNGESLIVNQSAPNVLTSIAFTSDTTFDAVTLVATDTQGPYFGIDNLFFGTAGSSVTEPELPSASEPAPIALWGLALLMLVSVTKQRRSK